MIDGTVFENGNYEFGFNYWASYAGTNMWNDWDEAIIERDLSRLADTGASVLRVFPLWRDFQPITLHRECFGKERVVCFRESTRKFNHIGQAGMDPVMLERFEAFTNLCEKYHFKLIIGLLTGWMSGRLIVPEALEGRNVLTDSFCLYWETKFVECFVEYFKNNSVIVAWELGNESNCMAEVENSYQAWLWSYTISSAIKKVDNTRPVLSGMHSLTPGGTWKIEDQGEVTDILTIHPYTVWTPFCNLDPCTTIKPVSHLAAELCFYRDIGQKPCFTEEIGTTDLRQNEENTCDFVRASLFNALAYDGFPLLWWCASYEKDLAHAPYVWSHGERGMGLLLPDGQEKPALNEFRKFKEMCNKLPFTYLPLRKVHAHAVLTDVDSWSTCLGSFLLSLQSGFSITYQSSKQKLKDSNFYLYPCYENSSKEEWETLIEKVKNGSSLYLSSDKMLGTGYEEVFGFKMAMMWEEEQRYSYQTSQIVSKWSKEIVPTTAKILLQDDNGTPLLLKNYYGKGTVYYCPVSIEADYAQKSRVSYTDIGRLHRDIYNFLSEELCQNNILSNKQFLTGITEHWLSFDKVAVVVVNYDIKPVEEEFVIQNGYQIRAIFNSSYAQKEDTVIRVPIDKNSGCILILEKYKQV
ncbi:MAG: hypothetical protein ACOX60_07305 [Massiliimalia sp.]|jgi:hypothetical protein